MTAMPPDVPAAAWPAPDTDTAPANESEAIETGDPMHEEVSRVAYALYEARGCEDGHADEDWFAAEEQVRRQRHGDRH